jgi:hypothetical protein
MKKIILLVLMGLITNHTYSQNVKMDTLLGTKGLFSKFKPKEISNAQKLSFNLKMTYSMKDKKGKTIETQVYFNTKLGYFGVINSNNGTTTFNPDDKNFNFMVYSHSLKNFVFTNDKKGRKKVISIPINVNNDFKMDKITMKKENVTSQKFTNLNIIGYPYNNSKTTAKDKVIFHLNDNSISGKYQYKNHLSFAGIGFYQIDNKTVLNMCIENNENAITLKKIESVAINFNGNEFKKENMEGMDKAMEEMMKNLKKK